MLVLVGGTWAFVALLDEVHEGETHHLDHAIVSFFNQYHGEHYRALEECGRDITALGGLTVLSLFVVVVLGYLLFARLFSAAALVAVATVGGLVLSFVFKRLTDRPRPALIEHLSYTTSSSFPSGHSMMSAVVYLTLGSLMARLVTQQRRKLYFLFVALMLTFLVGVSRVYMGVHWPTDVLAGWTAGLAWGILCWLVARYLQHRGKVETDQQAERKAASP